MIDVEIGTDGDLPFIVEMARFASTLEGRPIPPADDASVIALLPHDPAAARIACDGDAVGAAWWHLHDPPLVEALPELAMAVTPEHRNRGIGATLVDAVALDAIERFGALTLNVHLLNPAVRLYVRTGFRVAGKGRGWYGVAMIRRPD